MKQEAGKKGALRIIGLIAFAGILIVVAAIYYYAGQKAGIAQGAIGQRNIDNNTLASAVNSIVKRYTSNFSNWVLVNSTWSCNNKSISFLTGYVIFDPTNTTNTLYLSQYGTSEWVTSITQVQAEKQNCTYEASKWCTLNTEGQCVIN